jgi:hypothetical protein
VPRALIPKISAIRHAAIVEQDIYPVTYQRVWRPSRVSKLARIVPGLTFQILLPGTASSSTRSANPNNSRSTSRSPVGMLAESDDKRYPEARAMARTFREPALAGERNLSVRVFSAVLGPCFTYFIRQRVLRHGATPPTGPGPQCGYGDVGPFRHLNPV